MFPPAATQKIGGFPPTHENLKRGEMRLRAEGL